MKRSIRILSLSLLLSAVWSGVSFAQPKSVSSIWSLNGIGLGYEHHMDGQSFIQADLRAEMTEVFINRKGKAGATASFTWNLVFARKVSRNGNTIRYFAGPGAIAGVANDLKAPYGGIFGFKGRLGMECSFERHITLSLCIAPILGMHTSRKEDIVNMRLYRNGLIYGLLPEIGIKYAF